VIAFIVIGYFIVDNMRSFEYKGVEFEIVKFCDADPCLILFQTKLPVVKERGEKAEYNFFLRNDPRDLEDIKFDGNIKLLNTMVVNSKNDFNCDGDGIIAMANLVKLYEVAGTRVIKNEELDCPINNEYIYFELSEGGETKIINPISSCYVLRVNDCEIIPVTEKFMVETLVEINKMLE
jgi:hypothetical protein